MDTQTLHPTDESSFAQVRSELRMLMWEYVSLSRSHDGLCIAQKRVRELQTLVASRREDEMTRGWRETHNMLQVAELVIVAALERRESRGSHWRLDYQATDENLAYRHFTWQRQQIDVQAVL